MSIQYSLPVSWFLKILLMSSFLLTGEIVLGQPKQYYQHSSSDSTQGYWQLYTDYNSRMTRVSFYTSRDELLYQEKIKDRYFKLTKRNIRLFDNLLNRLVEHDLVADHVKSFDLLVSNQWLAIPQRDKYIPEEENSVPVTAASTLLTVNLKVVSSSLVMLSYLNPVGEKLLITIANDSYQYFYKNYSAVKTYAGLLNLSHLSSGRYRFEVDGKKKTITYELIIDQESKSLKLNPVLNQFL